MIRIIAKLFAVTAALIAFLPVQPSSAGNIVAFVSATGSGTACTQTAPCGSIEQAVITAGTNGGGRILCATAVVETTGLNFNFTASYVFDCPTTSWVGGFNVSASNMELKFQHVGFSGLGTGAGVIKFTGSGTLIFDDCVFEDVAGTALDIEPNGPLNLVIKNSRISNNGSGVLIKPAAGGSVTATFDGVTIADNTGGGVKTDTTNGAINLAISNSTISKNGGNGLNAVGGAFGDNILELVHDVIASNGTAGVQANGTSAAVLVNNTSILNNLTGATSIVAGGRILTYGNNSIVGTSGSGFTSTTPLQ
jgi:hypothetical protein